MLNDIYTIDLYFTLTIYFWMLLAWIVSGISATVLLWQDADLFNLDRLATKAVVPLVILTLVCIVFPPLPLWMVLTDGLIPKFYKKLKKRIFT